MTGVRYRLATKTLRDGNEETHVSTVVLSKKEAAESLKYEMLAHLLNGWHVTLKTNGTLVCRRFRIRREIRVIELGPMNDVSVATTSE
jgi:hypothetical protein